MFQPPFVNIIDPTATRLRAVDNGFVYLGKEDTDPTIPENQIPVYYTDENGTTQQLSQPIQLNGSGVPVLSKSSGTVINPVFYSDVVSIVIQYKSEKTCYSDKSYPALNDYFKHLFSAAGYSYQGQWLPNIQIPAKADRSDGYALWDSTIGKIVVPIKDEDFTTGSTIQDDINNGLFEEAIILTPQMPFLFKHSTVKIAIEDIYTGDPVAFGADPTGNLDSSDAFNRCASAFKRIKPSEGVYYIANPIYTVTQRCFDLYGSVLTTKDKSVEMFVNRESAPATEVAWRGGKFIQDYKEQDGVTEVDSTFFADYGTGGYGNAMANFLFDDTFVIMRRGWKYNNSRSGTMINNKFRGWMAIEWTGKAAEVAAYSNQFVFDGNFNKAGSRAFLSYASGAGIPGAGNYPEGFFSNSNIWYRFERNFEIRDILLFKSSNDNWDGEGCDQHQGIIQKNTFLNQVNFDNAWFSKTGVLHPKVPAQQSGLPQKYRVKYTACEFDDIVAGTVPVEIGQNVGNIQVGGGTRMSTDDPTVATSMMVCRGNNNQCSIDGVVLEGVDKVAQFYGTGFNNSVSNVNADAVLSVDPIYHEYAVSISNVKNESRYYLTDRIATNTKFNVGDVVYPETVLKLGVGCYALAINGLFDTGSDTSTLQADFKARPGGGATVETSIAAGAMELPPGKHRVDYEQIINVKTGGEIDVKLSVTYREITFLGSNAQIYVVKLN